MITFIIPKGVDCTILEAKFDKREFYLQWIEYPLEENETHI